MGASVFVQYSATLWIPEKFNLNSGGKQSDLRAVRLKLIAAI
jgi:hypothetical protein